MQRNRGKQQTRKKWRSLQKNWRYPGNISCKDGHNKGQNQKGSNRSRRDREGVARTHQKKKKKLYKKGLNDLDNHDGVVTH